MDAEVVSPRRARVVCAVAYRFEQPASGADLEIRLSPRALPEQRIEHHQLLVDPRPDRIATAEDEHGNAVMRVTLSVPFPSLEIRAVSTVARPAPSPEGSEARRAALEYLARWGVWPADPPYPDLPRGGREACRARAEAILARLRAQGIACRYVAGYPWPRQRGTVLPHAWVSVQIPDHGWMELDGTTGTLDPGYIVLGWGERYEDVAPISGALRAAGRYRLVSTVTVEPIA